MMAPEKLLPRTMAIAVFAMVGGVFIWSPTVLAVELPSPQVQVSATPYAEMNSLWTRYGDDNGRLDDWTGADGAFCVGLPDGRIVWSFSDTFLGRVNGGGSRPTSTPMINNDLVIQQDRQLVATLHGGTENAPSSLVIPPDPNSWYWTGAMTVEGNELKLTLSEYTRTGRGAWDWEWVGNNVASFSLPDLTLIGVDPLPSDVSEQGWSSGFLNVGDYTYVYGQENHSTGKWLHVARFPLDDIGGIWQYWTGSGWSDNEADSTRLVSADGTVIRFGNRYVLLGQDTSVPFSNELVAFTAPNPWGPFVHRTVIYNEPESGQVNGNLFTYGGHACTALSAGRSIVFVYSVNTFNGRLNYSRVTIYRPRYVKATIPSLAQ